MLFRMKRCDPISRKTKYCLGYLKWQRAYLVLGLKSSKTWIPGIHRCVFTMCTTNKVLIGLVSTLISMPALKSVAVPGWQNARYDEYVPTEACSYPLPI